ncbi:hypothetical protein GGI17_003177 [Coemansia sp. S146]|nr:hypothetical protein GGI17_003177 [Coemansia sp. S146]
MSPQQEASPQEVSPQQVSPQQVDAANAKRISRARAWFITLIVLTVLIFLANVALCGYYAYRAATRSSSSYYYYGSYYYYNSNFYIWRAGVCGGVALISICVLIFYIVRYRRTMRKLKDPNQYMTQGVTYVYQSNGAPVFYPPPGVQWQHPQQQGYAGAPYPQPAYGPPPPGQQPNPNFGYQPQQFPQPMQQQPPPANSSQL